MLGLFFGIALPNFHYFRGLLRVIAPVADHDWVFSLLQLFDNLYLTIVAQTFETVIRFLDRGAISTNGAKYLYRSFIVLI